MAEEPTCQKMEEKLRETSDRLSVLIEAIPDAIYFKDALGRHLTVNKACEELMGLGREKIIGKTDKQLLPPDFAEQCRRSDAEAIKRHKPTLFEEEMTNSEGENVFFETIKVPLLDNKGDVTGLVGISRDITERKQNERALLEKEAQLMTKAKNLEEVNTALRVLLKGRQQDKAVLEEKVLSNVKDLVLPYLEKLKKTSLNSNQRSCIDILESNLKGIVSPFSHRLSSKYFALTPTEIRVANLVKEGRTTKQIADFMNLSSKTIEFHRDNIRKKLGLKYTKANLRTHLLSM